MQEQEDLGRKPYDRATHAAAEEPEKAWESYFDQTYGPELARERKREAQAPIRQDQSLFAQWLVTQAARHDRVGAVARVALQDPTWPGGEDRRALNDYFKKMGARDFVMAALAQAWTEFDKAQRREANKTKRQAQKQARKANRHARSRKR